jgi:hypothetical protein
MKAVASGYPVLFPSLESLMTRPVRAFHENRPERSLQQLIDPKVPIIDEIGYLPLSQLEASLFFRLVVRWRPWQYHPAQGGCHASTKFRASCQACITRSRFPGRVFKFVGEG